MSEVVIINHGDVWGWGKDWFTLHCPKCSLTLETKNDKCPSCGEPIEYPKPKETPPMQRPIDQALEALKDASNWATEDVSVCKSYIADATRLLEAQKAEGEPSELEQRVEALKEICRYAGVPDVVVEHFRGIAKPTAEDLEWARKEVEHLVERNRLTSHPHLSQDRPSVSEGFAAIREEFGDEFAAHEPPAGDLQAGLTLMDEGQPLEHGVAEERRPPMQRPIDQAIEALTEITAYASTFIEAPHFATLQKARDTIARLEAQKAEGVPYITREDFVGFLIRYAKESSQEVRTKAWQGFYEGWIVPLHRAASGTSHLLAAHEPPAGETQAPEQGVAEGMDDVERLRRFVRQLVEQLSDADTRDGAELTFNIIMADLNELVRRLASANALAGAPVADAKGVQGVVTREAIHKIIQTNVEWCLQTYEYGPDAIAPLSAGEIFALQLPAHDLTGVKQFLSEIVSIDPTEGEALWIQTVKMNAHMYLGELAKVSARDLTEGVGESGLRKMVEHRLFIDILKNIQDGTAAVELDQEDATALAFVIIGTVERSQLRSPPQPSHVSEAVEVEAAKKELEIVRGYLQQHVPSGLPGLHILKRFDSVVASLTGGR